MKEIREGVALIRENKIHAQRSRYAIFGNKRKAWSKMRQLYDKCDIEASALRIYEYFKKKDEDLRYAILAAAEKKFIRGRGLKTRKRLEYMRTMYQSCSQAGLRKCGDTIQIIVSFLLAMNFIKNEVNYKRKDIVVYKNKKSKYKIPVNVKHTVREKSNDNDCPIKIVWGFPNNKWGGFTRQGFENWMANKKAILIVIDPQGRLDAINYAKSLGLSGNIFSLSEGLPLIRDYVNNYPQTLLFDLSQ